MPTVLHASPTRFTLGNPLLAQIPNRLTCGGYLPGQALPAGLIAHRLQTTTASVMAALDELAELGDVEYRAAGEHGPAYYLIGGLR
ncbi:hypothetical protein ACFY2N_34325 [Streptomyces rubiginosohelvolus]|uniref:hypothetical protein n=1 Tax=Streptomyces rubiginosohelvolus TaxID=67362 RepID=UPI00367F9CAC